MVSDSGACSAGSGILKPWNKRQARIPRHTCSLTSSIGMDGAVEPWCYLRSRWCVRVTTVHINCKSSSPVPKSTPDVTNMYVCCICSCSLAYSAERSAVYTQIGHHVIQPLTPNCDANLRTACAGFELAASGQVSSGTSAWECAHHVPLNCGLPCSPGRCQRAASCASKQSCHRHCLRPWTCFCQCT